jgi:hypothetical protein
MPKLGRPSMACEHGGSVSHAEQDRSNDDGSTCGSIPFVAAGHRHRPPWNGRRLRRGGWLTATTGGLGLALPEVAADLNLLTNYVPGRLTLA